MCILHRKRGDIDLEWKVPEITGKEILPDPDYQLQSSEEELAAKIALEPSMGGILAGKHMARIVLEYFSPQLYHNLDEWVQ